MPTPPLLSEQRIERGSVVSGPSGLLAVVVGVKGRTAKLCRVLHHPRYRHRSDVKIGMSDSLMMGVMVGNMVRCRVFRLSVKSLELKAQAISADLLARIEIAIEKESIVTRWERLERKSGGVSKVYG